MSKDDLQTLEKIASESWNEECYTGIFDGTCGCFPTGDFWIHSWFPSLVDEGILHVANGELQLYGINMVPYVGLFCLIGTFVFSAYRFKRDFFSKQQLSGETTLDTPVDTEED